MSLPQFIDIEYCDDAPQAFPTAIAWSLDDGRIKAVTLVPHEDWIREDAEGLTINLDQLHAQGVPLTELIREMNEDLTDATVYNDGLDDDQALIDLIFDSLGHEAAFELAPVNELIGVSFEDAESDRQRLLFDYALDPTRAEDNVYTLLLLAHDAGLIAIDRDNPHHQPHDSDDPE